MTRVSWNDVGQRFYEAGIDRGVLYLSGQDGVPWSGLIGVDQSSSGGEPQPYYIDGYKYLNLAAAEEYSATIKAYTSPREFDACDGTGAIHRGLFATQQPRKSFGFSYRSLIGNDVDGLNLGYKIHIVYNALAAPASRSYQTIGDTASPTTMGWPISTVPPIVPGIRPTAHFVIDSRLTPPRLLASIEDILYGSEATQSRLPTATELAALFNSLPPIAATNWATNGSFELVAPGVSIRRNYNLNPRLAGSSTSWLPGASYSQLTTTATSVQVETIGAHALTPLIFPQFSYPTVAGDQWSSSIEVTVPSAGTAITLELRNSSYGDGLTVGSSGPVTVQPGTTVTIVADSGGTVVGAGSTGVRSILMGVNFVSGQVFTVRNALAEKAAFAGLYFDGSTRPKLRRNASPNPQPKSAAGWETNNSGLYPRTWDAAGGRRVGSGAAVFTRSASTPNNTLASANAIGMAGWAPITNWIPVIPGEVWTISGHAVANKPYNSIMTVFFRDETGNDIGIAQPGAATNDTAANVWAQASITVTVPSGARRMAATQSTILSGGAITSGGEISKMTDALYEKVPSVDSFIDPTIPVMAGYGVAWEGTAGSSPSYMYDSDLEAAWSSTANNSASDLMGNGVGTYVTQPIFTKGIQSSRYVKAGTKSLRQIPAYPVRGVTHTEIASSITPRGLVAGQLYTLLIDFYQEVPQGFGDVSGAYRAVYLAGTANPADSSFVQAKDEAGEQNLRIVFRVPSSGSWYLRLYNGGKTGDPSVWWDNMAILDGDYEGTAFNGDTVNTDLRFYEWIGLPNQSPSVLRSWYY